MSDVNCGSSPGDDEHESGYAYIGAWSLDGLDDEFWNELFGASRNHTYLGSGDDPVAFFETASGTSTACTTWATTSASSATPATTSTPTAPCRSSSRSPWPTASRT